MSSTDYLYLDHNATAPLRPEAREAMQPFLDEQWGNPSSIHALGVQARDAVENARDRIAAVLGVRASEIVFTSGGTEAIHLAHHGAALATRQRRALVSSKVEHSATNDVLDQLERDGFDLRRLGVESSGSLDMNAYRQALDDEVFLVSLIAANNETGTLFDLDELGGLAQEAGASFHTDAVQLGGKGCVGLSERPVDMASFAGHKFGGPKGSGFLWLRRGTRLRPVMTGGHQERGRRGGTENVAGIVGMAAALEAATSAWNQHAKAVGSLRDQLEAKIISTIPQVLVVGAEAARIENTLCVCVQGVEGAAIVLTMSSHGVLCSSGSACMAAEDGPSHVLEAMGVANDYIHGAVRLSLSTDTTAAQVDRAVETLGRSVQHLRRIDL